MVSDAEDFCKTPSLRNPGHGVQAEAEEYWVEEANGVRGHRLPGRSDSFPEGFSK